MISSSIMKQRKLSNDGRNAKILKPTNKMSFITGWILYRYFPHLSENIRAFLLTISNSIPFVFRVNPLFYILLNFCGEYREFSRLILLKSMDFVQSRLWSFYACYLGHLTISSGFFLVSYLIYHAIVKAVTGHAIDRKTAIIIDSVFPIVVSIPSGFIFSLSYLLPAFSGFWPTGRAV